MASHDRDGWSSRKLWIALSRAFEAVREHAARDVDRHDLSLAEFGVLEALLHGGALQPGDLREKILVSSGGITYVVDRLEERGLVARKPHPEDRRARLVELTDAGRSLVERVFPQHEAALAYATSGLERSEKRRAVELLHTLGATAAELEKIGGEGDAG